MLRRARLNDLCAVHVAMLSGCSEPAPSSVRPVLARKTSSRLGACSWRCSTWRSALSSARTMSARPNSSPGQPHRQRLRRHLAQLSELLEDPRQLRPLLRIGGDRLHRRVRDLGLELGGRALGHDPPVVDDADAVREHVRLLEVLRGEEDGDAVLLREPSRPRPRAPCGTAGRGRSSARRGRGCVGRCTRASARSSRRFIPPEYVRTLRSDAASRPTRSRSSSDRQVALGLRRCRAAPSGAAGARGR